MKVDLNSLKTELSRLTDMKYLKKELNRIAGEVKKFDVHRHFSPQARERLEALEERFRDLLKNLQVLQKQVDENLERLLKTMRSLRGGHGGKRKAGRSSTKKKVTRKTMKKTASTRKKSSRS